MNDIYILRHKQRDACELAIDRVTGMVTHMHMMDPLQMPYLGSADLKRMKIWWEQRAVPSSRKDMERIIRKSGCVNSRSYLAKNLGLSLTDTYWLCPVDMQLKWEDVNLYNHTFFESQKIPYHNQTSYDQNASLGGALSKYWDISVLPPVLVKKTSEYFGLQTINEIFASEICRRQRIPVEWFTEYWAVTSDDGNLESRCRAFTNESMELVSAYEVLESEKIKNDESNYEAYIRICLDHGIDADKLRKFLDFQTLLDFVISNTDRHLLNFGVLRDSDTGKFLMPAPIFDNGNSMQYYQNGIRVLTEEELLGEQISSFYKRQERMLSCVNNRLILHVEDLPTKDEVIKLYTKYGILEDRAEHIADNYSNKVLLLKRWQNGVKVSWFISHKTEAT